MYYPYFRGRQFELITIRELAEEGATQGFITPIIEPVKDNHKNFDLAYKFLMEFEQKVYLIVNPEVGKLNGDIFEHLEYLISLDSNEYFYPAFNYTNNARYIKQAINKYTLHNCMILCKNDVQPDANFKSVVEMDQVIATIVEDPGRNRDLNRYLRGLGKTYIRLDDLFEKEARNKDYLPITERRFSEEHKYYKEEGFQGFSDFTALTSEYIDSGSTPRAVVIHLTYLKNDDEIWIRSFTSVTNDSIANVQGKFGEAAKKAVQFCQKYGLQNSAIEELTKYYNEGHYPGLGTVKKISMKNHLLVVADYLRKKSE